VTYPVEIRTNRLLIREISADDADFMFALTSNSEVVRYLEFGPTSRAQAQGLVDFATTSAISVPRTGYALAIVESGSDSLVGSCGLQASDDDPRTAELYFVFRRDRWGQGLASELVPALIHLALGAAAFARVVGVVHPNNAASIRVLERAGLTRDGVAPDAFPGEESPEGRWRDGLRYAILGG
jgi:[ribosomal protein S5]-alanine N-acetyltransferase